MIKRSTQSREPSTLCQLAQSSSSTVVRSQFNYLSSSFTLFSGEFYGQGFSTTNLDLLAAFYEKYPECADKTFLSVKGGINLTTRHPDAS